MRRLRFIPACLAFLLASCNEQLIEQPGPVPGETGRVQIALSADARNEIVGVKSTSEEEIPVDDFWVEIFNSGKRRIYCEKYADAKDMVLNLNTGDYRLLAKHGDSLGVGFNHAFYMADANFVVEPKKDNSVSAVAKLANVKAQVIFGENIINSNFYGDCYALIKNRNPKVKSALKFKKTETRAGYIPAGELVFEVYAKVDGQLMYYPVEVKTYDPNDFVTFHVDAGVREGDLVVTIKLDNTMEVVEKATDIPAEQALPADVPVVTAKSFDYEGNYLITEGESKADPDLEISVESEGGLKSLVMSTQSEYLTSLGLPSTIDFLNLTSEQKTLLENAGFVWYIVQNNQIGVIDFESVATTLAKNTPYDGSETKTSSFTFTATDEYGKIGTETVNIIWELSAKSTISAEDYDIWATKIIAPKATFTKGEPKYSTLEYSQDGVNWTSLGEPLSVNGKTATYANATGLQPGTPTQFRVVYKKDFYPRGEASFITEEAAQLGNSGFEDWTTQVHNYKTTITGLYKTDRERDWYRPWASENDSWWDVNSKKTLVSETSPEYQWGKCVPTVYYSSDAAVGGKSAQLISTCVCWGANDWGIGAGDQIKAAGEIFIGTSDANGNHATEGHVFPSRPASLSFKYKYLQHQDDQFHVYMYVADTEGNIIASKDFIGGTASSGWMDMTIDFDYTVFNRKAAKIYVCFRSTKLADADIQYEKKTISVLGEGKGYVGSILYLDDLKLNY